MWSQVKVKWVCWSRPLWAQQMGGALYVELFTLWSMTSLSPKTTLNIQHVYGGNRGNNPALWLGDAPERKEMRLFASATAAAEDKHGHESLTTVSRSTMTSKQPQRAAIMEKLIWPVPQHHGALKAHTHGLDFNITRLRKRRRSP